MNAPDFSSIDSLAKARALREQGSLEELLLLPAEFGGQRVPENVVYVPPGFAEIKAGIDLNVIGPLVRQGAVKRYQAEPEYQGDSFIPIALKIRAWEPREFSTEIRIWGNALGRAG